MFSRSQLTTTALAGAFALALTGSAVAKPKGWSGGPGWGHHAGWGPPGHMKRGKHVSAWRYAPPHRYGWMPPGHAKRFGTYPYRSARYYTPAYRYSAPRVYLGW
jgi:hypothetical protein